MRRHFLLLPLLLLARIIIAEPRLGPEVPLLPRNDPAPAAYQQWPLGVASNGRDFLVLWRDQVDYETSALQLRSIGADGRPVQPFGRVIQSGFPAAIASNGADYLFVSSVVNGGNWFAPDLEWFAQRLDENGNPAAAPVSLGSQGYPSRLVSNGRSYLLVGYESLTILDRDGVKLRQLDAPELLWAGVMGGQYVALQRERTSFNVSNLTLATLDESGFRSRITLALSWPYGYALRVAASNDRVFIANYETCQYVVADAAGVIATGSESACATKASIADVAWDGKQFLVMGFRGDALVGARYLPSGVIVDPLSQRLSPRSVPLFASNGTTLLMVWRDNRYSTKEDLVARTVHSFDELAAPGDDPILISLSARAQESVRLARAGEHLLAVWRDDAHRDLEGVIDGAPRSFVHSLSKDLEIDAAVAGRQVFLLLWHELGGAAFVTRIALNGDVLDRVPVEVCGSRRVGAARDVASFVVTCQADDYSLAIKRIDENGTLTTVSEKQLPQFPESTQPIVADNHLMLASYWMGLHSSPGVWPYTFLDLYPADTPPANRSDQRYRFVTNGAVWSTAVGPGHVTLAAFCHSYGCPGVFLAQSAFDGTKIRAVGSPALAKVWQAEGSAMVWDGTEYVLAWTELLPSHTYRVRAIRLNETAVALDAAPFDITVAGASPDTPSLVVTESGVLIGYSRADSDSGGAPRAYTRTLDRAVQIPRRSSARH